MPYTNLIMVTLYNSCPCEESSVKLEPKEVSYSESDRCHLLKNEMYRKRPTTCHNYHPQVSSIVMIMIFFLIFKIQLFNSHLTNFIFNNFRKKKSNNVAEDQN